MSVNPIKYQYVINVSFRELQINNEQLIKLRSPISFDEKLTGSYWLSLSIKKLY